MRKDSEYPQYDWIQESIDEARRAQRELEQISEEMRQDAPKTQGLYIGRVGALLKGFDEMVDFLTKEKISADLHKIKFSIGGLSYIIVTSTFYDMGELIKRAIKEHYENMVSGDKRFLYYLIPQA